MFLFITLHIAMLAIKKYVDYLFYKNMMLALELTLKIALITSLVFYC